jgi:dihydropteroate synthase
VGVSRKAFVSRVAGAGQQELEFGSAAANALAIAAGASIVRVHDVGAGVAAMRMAAAIAKEDRRFTRDA